MATASKCGECGTDLPADAPQGLCPKCLLRHGMNISLLSRETFPSIVANPVIRYFGDYEIERERPYVWRILSWPMQRPLHPLHAPPSEPLPGSARSAISLFSCDFRPIRFNCAT